MANDFPFASLGASPTRRHACGRKTMDAFSTIKAITQTFSDKIVTKRQCTNGAHRFWWIEPDAGS